MSIIKTSELDQLHSWGVYTPARLISFSGDVTEDSATQFIKNIRLMDHVTDNEITVLLNTQGGDVHQGMAMFDAIKECNSRVVTHAVGPCYSVGSIIFQAGDWRKISLNASLMVHVGSSTVPEDHNLNVDRWVAEFKRIGKIADDILFNRIKKKKPKYNRKLFNNLLLFDTVMPAEKAIEMGLADEIAEHRAYE